MKLVIEVMLGQGIPKILPRTTLEIEILLWPPIACDKMIDAYEASYAYYDWSILPWHILGTRAKSEQSW